jgi:large subunit ribosomal protein L18
MIKKIKKIYSQKYKRYRKPVIGTNIKPRLSIFRSNNHIYAQLIDDRSGTTLVSSSSLDKNFIIEHKNSLNTNISFNVGKSLAKKALVKNINSIVFDRDKYKFTGRVKNLIEGFNKKDLLDS